MLLLQAGFQVLATDGILPPGPLRVTSRGTMGPCNCAKIRWLGTGPGLLHSAVFCLGTQSSWGKEREEEAGEEIEVAASSRPDRFRPLSSLDAD